MGQERYGLLARRQGTRRAARWTGRRAAEERDGWAKGWRAWRADGRDRVGWRRLLAARFSVVSEATR